MKTKATTVLLGIGAIAAMALLPRGAHAQTSTGSSRDDSGDEDSEVAASETPSTSDPSASSSSSSSTTPPEKSKAPEYVGCYYYDKDEDDTVWSDGATATLPLGLTRASCSDFCDKKGAFYYATHSSKHCWCGTSENEGDYTSLGPGNCTTGCTGDETVACGGTDAFSLFKYFELPNAETTTALANDMTSGSLIGDEGSEEVLETTDMPTPSATDMPTPSATDMPTPSATDMPTPSATDMPTPSPTDMPTPSPTASSTASPTASLTASPTSPTLSSNVDCTAVIIFEAEALDFGGDWTVKNDTAASGEEYIVWEADEVSNPDPKDGDIIETSFTITTPGTYSFKWRMRQPSDVKKNTDENDSWLNFPDAERFGPAGTEESYGGFVNAFGTADGEFKYTGMAYTKTFGSTQIAIDFEVAKDYTMKIAGRSSGHQIDQIILFENTMNVVDAADVCQ